MRRSSVSVTEVTGVGGTVVTDGLTGRVILNPDIENPDIENPDIENPDIENPDIENAEVYNPDIENPDIENPDIENPDIENPDIENPDIENPDIENVVVANPDIENVVVANPDIENPDIENPDIENPDIENPDIENGTISDVTWTVSNTGNTTSAFNVNLFLANTTIPPGVTTQLVLYKTYQTPVAAPNGCELKRRDAQRADRQRAEPGVRHVRRVGSRPERSVGQERHAVAGAGRGRAHHAARLRSRSLRQRHLHQRGRQDGVDRSGVQPADPGDAWHLGPGRRSARPAWEPRSRRSSRRPAATCSSCSIRPPRA